MPKINPLIMRNYKSNKYLKAAGVKIQFTKEQLEERLKCASDPIYFIENYVKIIHVDKGLVSFDLYPFQKQLIDTIHNNRFTIAKLPRQVGKCFCINTIIKLRNKKTLEVVEMTIGQLYELLKSEDEEYQRDKELYRMYEKI